MPTIFFFRSFRIMIYLNDHEPAHVHCVGPGVEALIEIESGKLVKNEGVTARDMKKLIEFISDHEDELMFEWRHYHDKE